MKKIIFIIIATIIAVTANSQFVHKIKADSVLITNDSCTAEFNLENSTKAIKGFLYNKGNGRTEFRKGVIKIDDSIYIIGADTLNLAAASSSNSAWKIIGNTGTNPSINFLGTIDSIDLIIKTKGLENAIFNAGGGLTFRNANGQDKINLNKNGTGYLSVIHRFGQGENNYFSTPVSSSIIMDSAHKKGRGSAIYGERQFISKNGVTINPSTLDGASVQGYMNLRMSKGNYNFYSDLTGGFNTSAITANIHVATENTSDSIARYTFYGNNGGVTTGLSASTSRFDFSWSKPSDNFGFYNNFLSAPIFSGQAGRYTEKFNHFAAAFTRRGGVSGRVGMITGLYIENLLQDSVDRTWGVLQLGTNDWNAFRGKVMIGDSTQANAGLHRLYVDGRGRFTDTLTATTMGNTDSSDRVATTAWVKRLSNATVLPGGIYNQIQYNDGGVLNGATGFEYQSGTSPNILVTAQNAAHVPLLIQGATSQSANLLEVNNSIGTNLANISSIGRISARDFFSISNYGDIQFGDLLGDGNTAIGANGSKSIFFRNNSGGLPFQFDMGYAGIPTMKVRGASIFNEASENRDFLIKGNSNPALLFVNSDSNNVGLGTILPHPSSLLELSSTEKGFLPPRMTAAQRTSISSPSVSLFVWDTDSLRYMGYNGTAWKGLRWTDEGNYGGTDWNLNGNSGTSSSTNFLGTTDNVSLRFKTNNTARAVIDSNGKVGINNIAPDFQLDVNGDARVNTLPFLASRDTVLTYDPSSKQLKVTKLPAGPSSTKLTSDLSAYTSTSLTDASGLSFSVNANTYYHFKFIIVFSTASGNTGIRLSVSVPSSPDILSAKATIPIAADGTASELTGWITSSNDAVVGTGVQTSNTDYIAIVEGTLLTGANAGTLQLRYATEVSSSGVTIKKASFGNLVLY